jgi:hypothetical protein
MTGGSSLDRKRAGVEYERLAQCPELETGRGRRLTWER